MSKVHWTQSANLPSKSFVCGYCGHSLASHTGYKGETNVNQNRFAYIYICHHCDKPTFFSIQDQQTPGPIFGNSVKFIPDTKVQQLYEEARKCYSIGAHTSSTMGCRKLLMNIAVTEGAKEGKSFVEYVNYLNENNFIPPKGKQWVDAIRKVGNEANHSVESKTADEAKLVLTFTEMLLRFIYEMPGLLGESYKL